MLTREKLDVFFHELGHLLIKVKNEPKPETIWNVAEDLLLNPEVVQTPEV